MSFFSKWTRPVILPAVAERRITVGKNAVTQTVFPRTTVSAQFFDSQYPGHDLIKLGLSAPFFEMLIRAPKVHRIDSPLPVLTAVDPAQYGNGLSPLELKWDRLGELATWADAPDKVLASWRNRFTFAVEDLKTDAPGLRLPQVGALHAIAAHFSVGSEFEPATVVLPTGTGKTETMLATHVYGRESKMLVLVPSSILRAQIAAKFSKLGVLPAAGVIPLELARPFVAKITKGIESVASADRLVDTSNVIVATPDILKASAPDALERLLKRCSMLVVDEAHHITAATWKEIRDRFEQKKILQFTATPFRRDERKVDGKIIFNFKLGDAQQAGYYRPINLRSIEEFGDPEARDRAIAAEAVAVLRRDRNEFGFDHLLMARTKSKERAAEVWRDYKKLAPEMKPVLVYSGPGRDAANKKALAQLYDRGKDGSRIVVCVDMLGEGVDLPNLKIAALHDTHKSLAVTLQFIGRITRKGDDKTIGEATVVTNIADPDAEKKLGNLYAEGADWDKIIRRLSEERIEQELRLQDVVAGLKGKGTLHAQLSLWNLRPRLSTQIYRTSCTDWDPTNYVKVLKGKDQTWYALDKTQNLLVGLVHREDTVDWGNFQSLEETSYHLLVMWWDKPNNALFIYASDYDALRTEQLANHVTGDAARLLSGTPIFQILNNVQLPLAKSLGSSRVGAISFTAYFGPNVTEGLASIEKRESKLNNIACLGYEDGERVLWGGAERKGKVWQQNAGTLSEWVAWCARTWKKVSAEETVAPNITRDFLRPIRLSSPHNSHPIAIEWGEHAQMMNSDQFVIFDGVSVPLYLVNLDVAAVSADGAIDICISSETVSSTYRLTISDQVVAGYSHTKISGPNVLFKRSNKLVLPLIEHLVADPFIVRYADGTYSYNCYHIPANLDAGNFPVERLESWSWKGIPLNRESMGKSRAKDTIQYKTFQQLQADFELVFNDDGSGEAADLVALKDIDETTISLCLVHCKNAHGGKVTADIRNFYTLCGQAQKSVSIKHRGVPRLYNDLKRRHDLWMRGGSSRFLKGDIKKLAYFKDKSRRAALHFEVIIVQPGASAASINEDALKLLATTETYLLKTAAAGFRVIVSE
ncbi:DEAD/DEAH box helicase family protein [Bradyrhizobium sp. 83002]|uniref:DEAD/DEAH box helicase n=1 Tax=Bradyrhizobium aeschynomenes TaxID=2734909 RepID=UPI0015568420|nr:DEAD/DEAH box helicase family protein [Bradyrhizobium aeschynomenes]NPU11372.1 DEAD/DEAH box helicase family protein [Bradyrhizobium aeschynomenes]